MCSKPWNDKFSHFKKSQKLKLKQIGERIDIVVMSIDSAKVIIRYLFINIVILIITFVDKACPNTKDIASNKSFSHQYIDIS